MFILAVIATILLISVGQLCLRNFARSTSQRPLVINNFVLTGLLFYSLSSLRYIWVLKNIKISIVFPIIFGCTSFLIFVGSSLMFNELLTLLQMVVALVIITGVCLISIQ